MVRAGLGTSDGVVHVFGVDAPKEITSAGATVVGDPGSTPEGFMSHLELME